MANQEMLINSIQGEECRIAITEGGKLEELYTERTSADLHVGNIYRGKVTNVEQSIQAAFIDFGESRNGFLHITDLHPRYFPGEDKETTERVGHKTPRHERPAIQNALKRGQEVLVQVLKEGISTKGPTLTSYLSIPGKYLVMMPGMERHGVSRKVEDIDQRRAMRKILDDLDPPKDMGFIVRTAGIGRPKTELKRDLNYLLRLWKDIDKRMKTGRGPAELYVESDLVIRTLRDVMTSDVKRIIVDNRRAALRVKQFLKISMPRSTTKVYHYQDPVPLFDAMGLEQQIQQINQREVPLPSGGSLVFDQTEALVAIDVNSGKSRSAKSAEDTAYHTNQQAVDEIARQLRLRDLGGLIVLDLIDMYMMKHRREIEHRFQKHLKNDRARTKVMRISDLGMMEMTRQRMRPSLNKSVFDECPTCKGHGIVKSNESMGLHIMRRLAVAINAPKVHTVLVAARPEVLEMILNRKRGDLSRLELAAGKEFNFRGDATLALDEIEITSRDANGGIVNSGSMGKLKAPRFLPKHEVTVKDLHELDDAIDLDILDEPVEIEAGPESTETKAEEQDRGAGEEASEGGSKKRRRRRGGRRRRGKSSGGENGEGATPTKTDDSEKKSDKAPSASETTESKGGSGREGEDDSRPEGDGKKRRRRRRGGRRHRRKSTESVSESAETPQSEGYTGAGDAKAPEAGRPGDSSRAQAGGESASSKEKSPKGGGSRGRKSRGRSESDSSVQKTIGSETIPKSGQGSKTSQAATAPRRRPPRKQLRRRRRRRPPRRRPKKQRPKPAARARRTANPTPDRTGPPRRVRRPSRKRPRRRRPLRSRPPNRPRATLATPRRAMVTRGRPIEPCLTPRPPPPIACAS
ncbi:MAG: Rne/Rng family ribonuclease [Planctomycetota bacterium]|jgi:ribonuclease E